MLMEETSRIVGAGRIFAVIASRESRFVTTAQNGDAAGEQDERDASRAPTTTTRIATRRCDTASAGGRVRQRRPVRRARPLLPVDRRTRGRGQGAAAQRAARR
jgi:hypothetical protein